MHVPAFPGESTRYLLQGTKQNKSTLDAVRRCILAITGELKTESEGKVWHSAALRRGQRHAGLL